MSSEDLLFLAIPPAVGAVIGLFTNWLAIKMLFRPLLEKRILGLRVPFTPGILPRERKRLARSLGETVAVDLLDSRTVSDRLRSPVFKEAIRKAALSTEQKMLASNPLDLLANVDADLFPALRDAFLKVLSGVFSSEPFRKSFIHGVDEAVMAMVDTPLSDLVNPSIFPRIADASEDPTVLEGISRALSIGIIGMIGKAASNGKSLSDFIGKDALESFVGKNVQSLYPEIVSGIMKSLGDKDVVAMLEKTGAQIMRKAIDRMNAVQRFFIGLGQYDRAIMESMPETIADLRISVRDTLSNPATRIAVVERAKGVAAAMSIKPLSAFVDFTDQTGRDSAIASLAEVMMNFMSNAGRDSLIDLGSAIVSGGTVGDVLKVFPELKDKAGPVAAAWFTRLPGMGHGESDKGHFSGVFIKTFFSEFARLSKGVPLGETIDVDDDTLQTVAAAASEGLTSLAASESSTMLASIDIRSLVVDKIDSLDMIEVERMLLRIIDKELGAITAFGGVLGAIIGAAQSVLMLFR